MTKSYVWYLQTLFRAILSDCSRLHPTYRKEVERDIKRLASFVSNRGPTVFTIDLPAIGKHFDRCLSTGRLTSSGLPLTRSFRTGGVIPRLFKGMHLCVFGEDGLLKPDADIQAIRLLRQLFYAGKKFKIACEPERTFSAVQEFFNIEKEMRHATRNWDEDEFDDISCESIAFGGDSLAASSRQLELFELPCVNPSPLSLDKIQLTMDLVAAELGAYQPQDWRFKHGPGAVSDQRREIDKFGFPSWPEKLERIFPICDFAYANHGHWADDQQLGQTSLGLSPNEHPAKLIAVPKSAKGPRLICSEPTAHQWCQQSVRDFLYTKVRETILGNCLTFHDQAPSQRAALDASLTGRHSTIDLSSASDRLSCWLVERAFRRNKTLLDAFHAVRTRWVVNTIDNHLPKFLKLKKFTTQGSALTFPVQSFVYASIALGALAFKRGLPVNKRVMHRLSREVRVFGDDIIVPTDVVDEVLAALAHLGFKVNLDKTYHEGNFRESCGMDAFRGYDITPAYITRQPERSRPESLISAIETARNFFKRKLPAVSDAIKTTFEKEAPRMEIPLVPQGSGVLGWPTAMVTDQPLKRRWNDALQRMEYRYHVPIGNADLAPIEGNTGLHRFFTYVPDPGDSEPGRIPGRSFPNWNRAVDWWESPTPSYEVGREFHLQRVLRSRLSLKPRWEPLYT